jgi:hypothetical protein
MMISSGTAGRSYIRLSAIVAFPSGLRQGQMRFAVCGLCRDKPELREIP